MRQSSVACAHPLNLLHHQRSRGHCHHWFGGWQFSQTRSACMLIQHHIKLHRLGDLSCVESTNQAPPCLYHKLILVGAVFHLNSSTGKRLWTCPSHSVLGTCNSTAVEIVGGQQSTAGLKLNAFTLSRQRSNGLCKANYSDRES